MAENASPEKEKQGTSQTSAPETQATAKPRRRPPASASTAQGSGSTTGAPPPRRRRRPSGGRGPRRPRRGPQRRRPEEVQPTKEVTPDLPTEIEIPDHITVRDMAELMKRSPIDIIKVLMNFGIMAPITQTIDFDTAAIVGEEMGIKVRPVVKAEKETLAKEEEKKPQTLRQRLLEVTPEERLEIRPPVVTVLGHVDHGKTTLLDAIRHTNVVSDESGGITQHIGAYQIEHEGRKITFLDTPGHEAFTAMRARGAQATDIAVLVVAADDGVMPQTKEAIAHARAAEVPIIVALNKIDKANANPDRVKQELAENDLVVEEWGGEVICVPVSAKQQLGIEELLENLLLLADVEGFKADPEGAAVGTVIESSLDKARGATATLLVQKGTLKVGDALVVGTTSGRVRALFDSSGRPVDEATPSAPVVALGLSDVPTAGDTFQVVKDDRTAREMAAERVDKERQRDEAAAPKAISLDEVFAKMKAGDVKELRIVLKADVDGSLEPIINSLEQLSTEDLRIKLLHTGTGDISESDLMLAAASHAIVIGFHVDLNPSAQRSDLAHQVDVRSYDVIYELIDDVDKALKGLLEPVYEDQTIGRAQVRAVFRIPRRGNIAGCYVSDGEVQRNALARVQRNGTVVHESKISSLKRFQDDVTEVKTGFECGIGLEDFDDFEEGDIIEVYHKVRV